MIASITLHHLLVHASGIPDITQQPDYEEHSRRPSTAAQVVARIGEIKLDHAIYDQGFATRTAQASSATAIGVGVNWFLNRNVKLQLNYDHTTFQDGATAALGGDRESEEVIQSRVQFQF